jgi:ArsR family transcriptional regulator
VPSVEFIVSPQYEVCYALAALADETPAIHGGWCKTARGRLGDATRRGLAAYGSLLWNAAADITGGAAPAPGIDDFLRSLRTTDTGLFQRRLLVGILHDASIVEALASRRLSVKQAMAGLPAAKREWLAHVDLFPHDPAVPAGALIEALAESPEKVQARTVSMVEEFWDEVFGATWSWLAPRLESSRDRAERLFASGSLTELATDLRLLAEFDDDADKLRALRGGYRIALADLDCLYFMPSAFNHRRFWSGPALAGDGNVAFFPFFDHHIEVDFPRPVATPQPMAMPFDPVLACKALGDATRFSMLGLLAAQPRTAADLARELDLGRPTISHHVFQLRAAGLLVEQGRGKAVELSVNRAALASLSGLLVERLYSDAEEAMVK